MSKIKLGNTDPAFFAQAASVLEDFFTKKPDLPEVLDAKQGYAPRLSRICKKRIEELSDPSKAKEATPETLQMLRLESNTWDLVQLLMSVRKTEQARSPSAKELLRKNPYTPTATLAQAILRHSTLLNELVIVREWLHDSAPVPHPPEPATGYCPYTRHRLQQARAMGETKDVENLVNELDPDATNRGDKGKGLAAEDANYEKALAQALYWYIRAGKIDEAVDLCKKAKRPWRAACIRGSLLFDWKLIIGEGGVQGNGDGNGQTAVERIWSGNKRRKVWKQTCTRASLNPLLSEPDRALHAALAPSPATSVALKSTCRTWHDHLWAQVSIVCEGKTVDALNRAGGGYWDGGLEAVERIAAEADTSTFPEKERKEGQIDEREWENEAVSALEVLANVGVLEGPPSTDPFHSAQLHIILNRTQKLLNEYANLLRDSKEVDDNPSFPFLVRFFAHLCLFLRMIDMPVSPEATQTILECYLEVLQKTGQTDLVALYASALGENSVERYALFLAGLDNSVNINERRRALVRAKDHELDMIRVAQVTAEKSLDKALNILPRWRNALSPVNSRTTFNEMEIYLIRSTEWTTFYTETYPDALEQANAIIRYFLSVGTVEGPRSVLRNLPPKNIFLPEDGGASGVHTCIHTTEYMHYLQFFAIWELFDQVNEAQVGEGTLITKGEKDDWLVKYTKLLDTMREKTVELLTMDWLVNEEEVERSQTDDQRILAMVRIRRMFLPELILRLHNLLVGSGHRIPRNIKHAFDLANVVADSRYRVYEDFISHGTEPLEVYLRGVRKAVLVGLENGGSDPFKPLRLA